ncbi:MAG: flagellar biosynthesis protein FlhF [Caldimonas sp.]
MNVKRFTARTSREALRQVREQLGVDAVVLSTKPSGSGVEVLAMAPEGMRQVEAMSDGAPAAAPPRSLEASTAEQDAARLEMSTLSFQDYVRTRMLKRRQAAIDKDAAQDALQGTAATGRREGGTRIDVRVDDDTEFPAEPSSTPAEIYTAATAAATLRDEGRAGDGAGLLEQRMADRIAPSRTGEALREPPVASDPIRVPSVAAAFDAADAQRERQEMLSELRSMKGLIEERFGALAFMEKLQRRPAEARLSQKLLDCGFSPALIRKIAEGLSADITDEATWAAQVLERNLKSQSTGGLLEDQGGVFALIGATGVGKTTTTAKIAAAFAARHGAGSLGLVTLDAYRVGAHEQLRAYGRILGVPVHTAHDRASLEDLLELLGGKKMVLIDTAGMAQRDTRTRELLEMLSHRSIQRLLVVNAASQGETIEDVLIAYGAATCIGVVLSKLDEAVKLGPALDAAIRHKLKIVGIANGQRVPEDWHHLSASALVQRALRGGGTSAWRFDASEMNLVFAAPQGVSHRAAAA